MSAPLTAGVRQGPARIPVIIAGELYATDAILLAELGIDRRDLRTAVAILYAERHVDRVGDFIVAPAARASGCRTRQDKPREALGQPGCRRYKPRTPRLGHGPAQARHRAARPKVGTPDVRRRRRPDRITVALVHKAAEMISIGSKTAPACPKRTSSTGQSRCTSSSTPSSPRGLN